MPLKSEKNACLFGSLFRNYLPLHPISQLKALIISVFITIQGFDKTMFREVRTWNIRAVKCYQKAGFRIDGQAYELTTGIGTGTFYRMIRE